MASRATSRGSVIDYPEQDEPHRWHARPGLTPLEGETHDLLRRMRWRERPRERRVWWATLAIVALLHAVFGAFIAHEMQPHPLVWRESLPGDKVMQVRFIEPVAVSKMPPPINAPPAAGRTTPEGNPPAPRRSVTPTHDSPARSARMTARIDEPASAATASEPPPRLYDKRGSVVMPPPSQKKKPVAAYIQHVPRDDAQIMKHTSPIPDRTTSLDKYFPPPDETAAGELGRRVANAIQGHVTGKTEFNLPGGTHLKCKTLLGIPTPLCSDPPPPPPSNDGDERMNMPPPSLAADPHPKPKPPLALCFKQYRERSGLAQGCPVNTPALAYKAELSQCIALYRAGKRLKTWCPADIAKRAADAPPASASTAPALPDIGPGDPDAAPSDNPPP